MRLASTNADTVRRPAPTRGPYILEQRWPSVRRLLLLIAIGTTALAAVLHPFLAERYLSDDGQLSERSRTMLYVAHGGVAVIAAGLFALWHRFRAHTPGRERLIVGCAFAAAGLALSMVACEAALRAVSTVRPLRADRHFFFSYDPYLGWRHRPGAVARFKNTIVRINADGLRDHELPRVSPPSERRILFLGDSQVFGDGVEAEETFVERLERAIQGVQALNAGVIGYGTDQQLLYYEQRGAAFHPHLTVVGLNAYDLRDNLSDVIRSGYRKPRFEMTPAEGLQLRNVPVSPGSIVDRVQSELRARSYTYTLLGGLLRNGEERRSAPARARREDVYEPPRRFALALQVTRAVLARLNRVVTAAGGRLLVLFLPYEMDYSDPAYTATTDRLVRALEHGGEADGYRVVDLREGLAPGRGLFLDTMHFNADGHRVAADALRDLLVQQDLGVLP